MKEKNTRGITLIALIITVIILLILAGTAISISINGGNLFGKAANARTEWNASVAEENRIINSYWAYLDHNYNGDETSGGNNEPVVFDNEHPWGEDATEDDVEPQIFTYARVTGTGNVDDVDGVYELGKVADLDGSVKLADNTSGLQKVKITGFDWDTIFADVDGYSSITSSDEVWLIEDGYYNGIREPYYSIMQAYANKLVIPATVKLNPTTLKYDANGTEFLVSEIASTHPNDLPGDCEIQPVACVLEGVDINLIIPNTIEKIDAHAFECCHITDLVLPNSITRIEDYTFSQCGIENLIIPNSVTSIGKYAFDSNNFESLIIPSSVTSIGEYAFHYCRSLKSVAIPDSVTSLETAVFRYCYRLQSINLPNTLTTIGDIAFQYCEKLNNVTIPSSVTSIGDGAFFECKALTSITIPSSVTSIGLNPFRYCTALTTITVDGNNEVYDSRNDCNAIIKKLNDELISGCKTTVIPNTVTRIGNYAFNQQRTMSSISIPSSVTSIGEGAFSTCTSLENVTIPGNVEEIESNAFADSSIRNLVIEDGVEIIGSSAFINCNRMSSVIIPTSVTSIGSGAFKSLGPASNFAITINYKGTQEQWNAYGLKESDVSKSSYNSIPITINYNYVEP